MALVGAGVLAARAALAGLRTATTRRGTKPAGGRRSELLEPRAHSEPAPAWARSNYRGTTVNLAGGPALAIAASLTAAAGAAALARAATGVPGPAAAAAALTAGLGSGAVGLYDDLVGARPEQRAKGFHGHLTALRGGRVTSGVVKIAGIGAAGLTAAALLSRGSGGRVDFTIDTLVGAGVVAGAANLLNLLDLRPGRALKVGLLVGVPLAAGPAAGLAAGPVGAAAALLPEDLREETMLGDCGANALGGLLGAALVVRTGRTGRLLALAGIAGLTAASERVSFTRVIARTPGLRELDELGRHAEPRTPPSIMRLCLLAGQIYSQVLPTQLHDRRLAPRCPRTG